VNCSHQISFIGVECIGPKPFSGALENVSGPIDDLGRQGSKNELKRRGTERGESLFLVIFEQKTERQLDV
jgi:hypothetical protein